MGARAFLFMCVNNFQPKLFCLIKKLKYVDNIERCIVYAPLDIFDYLFTLKGVKFSKDKRFMNIKALLEQAN